MKWPEGIESNISLSLNTLDYTQPFRTDWSMRGGDGRGRGLWRCSYGHREDLMLS